MPSRAMVLPDSILSKVQRNLLCQPRACPLFYTAASSSHAGVQLLCTPWSNPPCELAWQEVHLDNSPQHTLQQISMYKVRAVSVDDCTVPKKCCMTHSKGTVFTYTQRHHCCWFQQAHLALKVAL